MDFIEWCHHVLQTLENERFNPHLSDHALENILFGETAQQPAFHTSDARHGMFHAIKALSNAGLIIEEKFKLKISPFGRKVLPDPTAYWTAICEQELDPEEEEILNLVNTASQQQGTHSNYAWLKDVEAKDILAAFNIPPPPAQSNEHMRELRKYI